MSFFRDLMELFIGEGTRRPESSRPATPQQQLETRTSDATDPGHYSAGLGLIEGLANLPPSRVETSALRASGVNRERHWISPTEYIDSETHFTIEEQTTATDWTY